MDFETFCSLLRDQGSYETPPGAVVPTADRLFGERDTWYYFRLVLITVAAYLAAVRGRFDQRRWARQSFATLRLVEGCRGHVVVEGVAHVASLPGPAVIVSNHMSLLETYLFACLLHPFNNASTVVKESLTRYPLFGRVLRTVRPIAVSRRNPREDLKQVLTQGSELLNEGRHVVIFPQATRTVEFDPQAVNTLGIKLARRAGVPVLPLALRTDFHGIGRRMRDAGPIDRRKIVHFRFGPPGLVVGREREAHRATVDFIADSLRLWGTPVVQNGVANGGAL